MRSTDKDVPLRRQIDVDELKKRDKKDSPEGQGYNDARGEVPDKKDIPKHNGRNINNDPDQVDRPRPR
jgi:hypothetical protein